MNRKNRRIMTVLLAALLVVAAVFAGCASTRPTENTDATADITAKTSGETDQPESTQRETTPRPTASEPTAPPRSSVEEPSTEKQTSEADSIKEAIRANYGDMLFVVTTDVLNVRSQPSTSAPIVAKIARNGGGTILETVNNDWYRISSGEHEGYVFGYYTVIREEALDLAVRSAFRGIRITASSTDVRAAADPASSVLGTVGKGATYSMQGRNADYYKIEYNGQEGYVLRNDAEQSYFIQGAYSPGEVPETVIPVSTEAPVQPTDGTQPTEAQVLPRSYKICIDAGHRAGGGIYETEPNGPGSSIMKTKLTSGTQGSIYAEHEVNLMVSLKLQQILQARGYTVMMIRTTGECTLSNAERALAANQEAVDAFIRIHCNGSDNTSTHGALAYVPSDANIYLTPDNIASSKWLGQQVLNGLCAATGARNAGLLYGDDMTGINWSQVPVTIIEMGFMSNPQEDALLSDDNYQTMLAEGMANGIDAYFGITR